MVCKLLRINVLKIFLVLFIVLLNVLNSNAQAPKTTRILFIFDMSNSMWGQWEGGVKIDIARKMMVKMLDSIAKIPNMQVALRMYGHQYATDPQNCGDTKLEVPFGKNNIWLIKEKLLNTRPKGTTPIARSLLEAGDDFPPCANCTDVIILITDGIEACSGDPCAIALQLKQKGLKLEPYVIGVGLDVDIKSAFECFGDHFLDADKSTDFSRILETVVSKYTPSGGGTKVKVELLDINKKPTETNVNMTFFDNTSGKMLYNYIHTLTVKGEPDEIELDLGNTYRMVVNTLPQVEVANIRLVENAENIIKAYTPQGSILVKEERGYKLENISCIIRKAGDCKTLNIQKIRQEEKFLVGLYDIEIHTLPITYYKNIQVNQSKTTFVDVPEPGIINFAMPSEGYGSVYQIKKYSVEWVCNLNNKAKETLLLQPGNYLAVYRPAKMQTISSSRTKEFTVKSGYSDWVRF